jgi:hypothetical protein
VLHHSADTFRIFHQHSHFGGAFGEVVAVLLREIAGNFAKSFVDSGAVDLQPYLRRLEMQR